MKPVMKTEGRGQKAEGRDGNGNTPEPAMKGGMPSAERGAETTLVYDESIGCYRWGVKGK